MPRSREIARPCARSEAEQGAAAAYLSSSCIATPLHASPLVGLHAPLMHCPRACIATRSCVSGLPSSPRSVGRICARSWARYVRLRLSRTLRVVMMILCRVCAGVICVCARIALEARTCRHAISSAIPWVCTGRLRNPCPADVGEVSCHVVSSDADATDA